MRKLFSVLIMLYFILSLVACGGGGGGDTNTNTKTVESPASVVGVFSVEQPIANADISLKDANGTVKTAVTDTNGVYYFDTSDMKPPFVIKGSYTSASILYTYYSYVTGTFTSTDNTKANINEFTNVTATLLVAQSGNGNDPATLFTETDANRTTMLNTDIYQALTAFNNFVCPVLLSADQTTSVGCNFAEGENFVNILYATDPTINDIDKLALLIDVSIDPISGDLTVTDSSGATIAIVTMEQILASTISADAEITVEAAALINNLLTNLAKQAPLENEAPSIQLSSGNTVSDKVEYNSIFPNANLQINKLTECPTEVRGLKINYSNPADNLKIAYVPPNGNYTPLIDTVVPEATMDPVDSCKRFSFSYEYKHNLVIRKTQTGLVNGVPVWEYDVPACEQYSNKVVEAYLEDTYKYTDVDFELLFNRPAIEVRPAQYMKTGGWPDSSVTFVYAAECPIVAGFSLSPTYGAVPLSVNVDASNSVGNIVSYEWTTSTGDTLTSASQSITFNNPGIHTISLKVTDANGKTDTISKTVTADAAPLAVFTWTQTASLQVKLDGSGSTGGGINTYQWTTSDNQTAAGQIANFTFTSAGDYSVTLTITDRNNITSTVTETVTVAEVAPFEVLLLGNWLQQGITGTVILSFNEDGTGKAYIDVPGYLGEPNRAYTYRIVDNNVFFHYVSEPTEDPESTVLTLTETQLSLSNPSTGVGNYIKLSANEATPDNIVNTDPVTYFSGSVTSYTENTYPYTFDVLANDIGNIGNIVAIGNVSIGQYETGDLKISADGKSILYNPGLSHGSLIGNGVSAVEFSFTYTALNLDTSSGITGQVNVSLAPSQVTIYHGRSDDPADAHIKYVIPTKVISDSSNKKLVAEGAVKRYDSGFSAYNYGLINGIPQPSIWDIPLGTDMGVLNLYTSYTYSGGALNGPSEYYAYVYRDGEIIYSTCATSVGSYLNGWNKTGTWYSYWESFSLSASYPACELRGATTY